MFKKSVLVISGFFMLAVAQGQSKFFTKTAKVEFFSKASLEDIQAVNRTTAAVLDTKTGAFQFSALMKGFEFEKALMQEHFNENYVESDKFPKAEFKGVITNNGDVDYSKDGTYNVKVKGKMTVHGVTKDIETAGTLQVKEGKIQAESAFNILLSDYNVAIPTVVKDKISNNIKIMVNAKLEPLKA
jgi:polyisoprenoid-binding protein YceI